MFVFAHIREALHLFSWMDCGSEPSSGHSSTSRVPFLVSPCFPYICCRRVPGGTPDAQPGTGAAWP
jgi:hypothetical protein